MAKIRIDTDRLAALLERLLSADDAERVMKAIATELAPRRGRPSAQDLDLARQISEAKPWVRWDEMSDEVGYYADRDSLRRIVRRNAVPLMAERINAEIDRDLAEWRTQWLAERGRVDN